jgi:two-component system, NarL family, response regulator YdfI
VISVFLVSALPRARRELELTFEQSDIQVVGSSSEIETAAEELSERETDILLVKVDNDLREGLLESIEEMRLTRETAIVFLVEQTSVDFVQRAARSGVKGILASEVDAKSLRSALQAVADGFLVLSPEESAAIQTDAGALREPTEAIEALTTREKEVLQKIANGLANKEIAVRLNISEHTVKFHVASILGKLGASSRTEAVTIGMRRGLILV